VIAQDRVATLEHLPEWKAHVQKVAKEHSIPANLLAAPPADYGGFQRYSVPESLPGNFELVICDGPPGRVVGGRYGLLPVAKSLLSRNVVIVMDDADHSDERAIIERWKPEFGVHCEEYSAADGSYAVVRLAKWAS
jgi:hypothetical protein